MLSSAAWLLLALVYYADGYCSKLLCSNSAGGTSPTCGAVTKRGVTEADKQEIVQLHNTLRSKVANGQETRPASRGGQPSAANMRQMEWDDDIAAKAQARADTCEFEHDCHDCMKTGSMSVGQNLAAGQASWTAAINGWYGEVDNMQSNLINSFKFGGSIYGVVGHYSQLVWAETYKIGCGYMESKKAPYGRLYVCNYGPAGNYGSQPIYKTGGPCAECPDSCSTAYPGLCTAAATGGQGGSGDCKDVDENCGYYAGAGYCTQTYVAYMKQNCQKTCKFCS